VLIHDPSITIHVSCSGPNISDSECWAWADLLYGSINKQFNNFLFCPPGQSHKIKGGEKQASCQPASGWELRDPFHATTESLEAWLDHVHCDSELFNGASK